MSKETVPASGQPIKAEAATGLPDRASIATTNPLPQIGDSQPFSSSVAAPGAPTMPNGKTTEPLPRNIDRSVPAYTGSGLNTGSLSMGLSPSRRKLFLRLALALVSLLLVVESAYLAPFMDSVAAQAARMPSPVLLAEVQPYGVNTFLHKEVDRWKKDKTLQMAQEMGVGWVKQQFPWAELEYRVDPAPGREYWDVKNNQNAWDKFDGIVDMAEQHGLRIIARIDSAPRWSHPENEGEPKAPPSADYMDDFGAFIETFVKRYHGRIAAIQVWNEPNLKGEWATGRPVNVAEYVELLKTAYTHAKAADPNIIILAAPLATTNERVEYNGNMNEFDYLQQMYDAGAGRYFDAMSANAYGKGSPPEEAPSPEKLNFRRVELLREVMVKNGEAGKAVWFNEYGWNASPPNMEEELLFWGRVTPQEQAEYTVRGIRYARDNWPWAGVFTIWYMRQVGDIPNSASEYYFGLVNFDFAAGAAYRAVQQATREEKGPARPGVWGPISTAIYAGPAWRLYMQPDAPGGVAIAPSARGDALEVPFTGTDVKVTLVPITSTGAFTDVTVIPARYYVSIDSSSDKVDSTLPRDSAGDAYLEATPGGGPVEVTVARSLGDQLRVGQHTLQIRVAADPFEQGDQAMGGRVFAPMTQRIDLPGIAAITVESHRSYLLFGLLTFFLFAASGALAWALRLGNRASRAASGGR
ncbi:MAG: cellulase family glycosylhydrolase [Chloroflexia bacterium]